MKDSRQPPEVVLVTGAAGKTGRAVIGGLVANGVAVRAFVRNPQQRLAVELLGADQVVEGDLLDGEAVIAAVGGAHSIYHICPNVNPDETDIGRRVITAASEAGVERFALHSVLHPQTEAMPHHWAKLRVEELLLESGLPFTILQPAPYMQNILGQWERIARQGIYSVPYALSSRIAMVDLEDVAAVAVRILSEPHHAGATYELCGPDQLDQIEIATLLGRHLGTTVRAETLPLEVWSRSANCSPGSYPFETLVSMFRYYERHGMAGSSGVLEWLLDRPPTGLADFLEKQSGQAAHS